MLNEGVGVVELEGAVEEDRVGPREGVFEGVFEMVGVGEGVRV